MAAARLAIAALRIPWKELLKAAPLILRASAELVARLSDRRRGFVDQGEKPADAAAVLLRLDALETSDVAQAQLAKEMAGQLNEVTEALRVVAVRILFALGASGIAVALALTAAIRTLL